MPTVIITGGTGMIGTALSEALLKKKYNVIILTRDPRKAVSSVNKISYAVWDIKEQTIDADAISKADFIVHLAGANIGEKRWTAKRKKEIIDSRIESSRLIVKALKENQNNVKAVVSASAIGYYGEGIDLVENDPPADDFLGQTGKKWEESIEPVAGLGKRLVTLRTAPVLSNEAGYLPEFKKYLRFGLVTILGNGKQIISWIHIDDLVNMYITAIENESMSGVYNAVAPNPVNNKEFVLRLGKIQRGKFFIPVYVPAFILKIILGEMSVEVLKSSKVSCNKIQEAGFDFQFPVLQSALKDLKSKNPSVEGLQ